MSSLSASKSCESNTNTLDSVGVSGGVSFNAFSLACSKSLARNKQGRRGGGRVASLKLQRPSCRWRKRARSSRARRECFLIAITWWSRTLLVGRCVVLEVQVWILTYILKGRRWPWFMWHVDTYRREYCIYISWYLIGFPDLIPRRDTVPVSRYGTSRRYCTAEIWERKKQT